MTSPSFSLPALPGRDDVTPVVRLLTHHIDLLEQELNAAKAERDRAFSRGLQVVLDAQGIAASSLANRPIGHNAHPEVASPVPSREAAPPRNFGPPRSSAKATFIAAARRAAQAANETSTRRDSAGVSPSFLNERRPIVLVLSAVVLVLGTLQVSDYFASRSTGPTVVSDAKPRMLPDVAVMTPQPRYDTTLPARHMEHLVPRTTALPAEVAPQEEWMRAPQPSTERASAERDTPSAPAASAANNLAAIYNLAVQTAEGRGVTRDLAGAARLFEEAAVQGLAPAQYSLGRAYEKGLGVERDVLTAKQWYQRAAHKGNALAAHQLAVLTAEGIGGKPDYAAAVTWFRRAAEHGIRDSQFNLGVLLARGLGTGQDLPGSYTWFAIAAAQGDEDAAKKRDEVGSRLSAPKLEAAKVAAARWRPSVPDKLANEVQPDNGSTQVVPAKRTASVSGI